MNTFLPNGYAFDKMNLVNQSKANRIVPFNSINQQQWLIIGIIVWSALLIFAVGCFLFYYTAKSKHEKFKILGIASAVIIFSVTGIQMLRIQHSAKAGTLNDSANRAYKEECLFKLHNKSNLVVGQDKNNYPTYLNDQRKYPYKLYYQDAHDQKLISLGTVKDGKFMMANNKTAYLFASYNNYIVKHHLTDKFKNKAMWHLSDKYLDNNGLPQMVLEGDGTALAIKPAKTAQQIYQVKPKAD